MAFMTKDEYEAYVAEHASNVVSAEDIANIKSALHPLIGAQFNILSIPKETLLAFEPSQIGTIIGSLMDACIPQLSKITESNTFDSVRKENEGKDLNEDTNFGKLKRIPYAPLHQYIKSDNFTSFFEEE